MGASFRVMAVAAALVTVVLMTFSLLNRGPADVPELSNEEIHNYILANLDDFSEAEIAQYVGAEPLALMASDTGMISNEDINYYLINELDYFQLQDEWL